MPQFSIGDRVHIRPDSRFYNQSVANPDSNVAGTVKWVYFLGGLKIWVKWDNGYINLYVDCDLQLIGAKPVKKKFAGWLKEKGL